MAWSGATELLGDGRVRKVTIAQDGAQVSHGEVVGLWQTSAPFRTFFNALLADAPYDALLWETPAHTRATIGRPFECVLIDCPPLGAMMPEPDAFADHFAPSETVATFANLGGDALLVAPASHGPPAAGAHLVAFCRHATAAQQDALWQAVGEAVEQRLSAAPLWLSTSGLGIAWLHVRLDDRPKYYAHTPYRHLP